MLIRPLLLALILAPGASAWAARLQLTAVDYGVPGEPYTNPILPGEEGDLFLTLANESDELLRDVALTLYPGDCVESVQRDPFRIAALGARETARVNAPVRLKIKASCPREKVGSFLLVGSYRDVSGSEQRIWMEAVFVVGQYPTVDFLADNLNLPIPAVGTVFHDFQIASAMSIRQIGVFVRLEHSAFGDLKISLRHPSGRSVMLRDSRSGNGLLELRLGLDGDPHPELNALLGLPSNGTWRLTVVDGLERDSGVLHTVGLKLR